MGLLDWENLSFSYTKTKYNLRCTFKNGQWGKIEVTKSQKIDLHIAATCLHYGQEAFEGLKAFRGKDNKIRIFRLDQNAKRMEDSARGIMMQPIPESLFAEITQKAVKLNEKFLPPYGSEASLYIRPLLIGIGAEVGVKPTDEYLFLVFVTPVGPYFKDGFKPIKINICREFDRAAPQGTGNIKVGGNYAASLIPSDIAQKKGFSSSLFLDAKEKKFIDECGPANFFAIKDNTYITPKSNSILPSITNKSLMQLAQDMGMKVEVRPVPVDELSTFDEVGQCGTAAVITPVSKIVDEETGITYEYCKDGNPGPVSLKLYNKLKGIQKGDEDDMHNWNIIV